MSLYISISNNTMTNLRATFTKGAFKERWVYPSLEQLRPNREYTFSFSPLSQHQNESPRFITFYKDIEKTILPYIVGHYKLYWEVSTKSQNIHFHGTICWQNTYEITKFYLFTIPKLKEMCTFELDTWNGYQWTIYCLKQQIVLSEYLDELHKLYDIPYTLKCKCHGKSSLKKFKLLIE